MHKTKQNKKEDYIINKIDKSNLSIKEEKLRKINNKKLHKE